MTPKLHSVVLTRSEDAAAAWQKPLGALGLRVRVWPCITTRPCAPRQEDHEAFVAALAGATPPWLVCTSPQGASALRLWLDDAKVALPAGLRAAAVGPATREAMRAMLNVEPIMATPHTAEELAALLVAQLPQSRVVLLPQSSLARPTLAHALERAGHRPLALNVYETVPYRPAGGSVPEPAPWGAETSGWQVVVASPSAVTGLSARVGPGPVPPVLALGPVTYEAACAELNAPVEMAPEASLEGVLAWFRRQKAC